MMLEFRLLISVCKSLRLRLICDHCNRPRLGRVCCSFIYIICCHIYLHSTQAYKKRTSGIHYVCLWSISIWCATFAGQQFLMVSHGTNSPIVDFYYSIIHCFLSMNCSRFYANPDIIHIWCQERDITMPNSSDRMVLNWELLVSNCLRRTHFNTLHNRRSFISNAFINTIRITARTKSRRKKTNQFGYIVFSRIDN